VLANAQSLVGVIAIPAIAWLLRERCQEFTAKHAARIAGVAIGLQLVIAAVMTLLPVVRDAVGLLSQGVAALQAASNAGSRMVFGYLAGGAAPFEVTAPQNGFILGLQALPIILVMSVLSRLLYHWGVLQRVIAGFAWLFERSMGIGGALSTSAAANIFVGMVEAPLLVRPYLVGRGRGPLFAVMTVGMASVAGTVMVLYANLLEPTLPGAIGHILIASVMSAPAGLAIARIMVPAGFEGETGTSAQVEIADAPRSVMDAIARGTQDGLKLLVSVAAMLMVAVALVALGNALLGWLAGLFGANLSIEQLLGWLATPLAILIGIPPAEAVAAGELIGVKTVLNEFLAYLKLAAIPGDDMSERTRLILTYALCGFANFGSLGIMTGGLIAMCPERYDDIVSLGPKTLVSGTLATLLTGAVIGVITV
jgi:CNT family concentrative nucleoside transporter